jgi:hypothetical protein
MLYRQTLIISQIDYLFGNFMLVFISLDNMGGSHCSPLWKLGCYKKTIAFSLNG